MTRPMNHDDRRHALDRIAADLAWLHTPWRPPCPTCDGSGRTEGICRRCDGIGSLAPADRRSPLTMAGALLLDRELQAAVIAAQHPEGGNRTEGATGWSDPTGEAASDEANVELRAQTIRRGWAATLDTVHEGIETLHATIAEALACQPADLPRGARVTLARIRWLTIAPQHRMRHGWATLDDEATAEADHAIAYAAQASSSLRTLGGRPDHGGKPVPSVLAVLEGARRVHRTAPAKPVQQKLQGCVSCARDGGHFAPICTDRYDAKSLCRMCGDYAAGEGSWPPVAALAYVHRTGKRLTWKVLADAKRAERARSA